MESRGGNTDVPSTARPAIPRRSCDQCRSRKIGCERGSPCSNCISAKFNCTYSALASKVSTPKQRVLISAQYEQKIDSIVNGIDGIKLLLQGLNPDAGQPEPGSIQHLSRADLMKPPDEHHPICESGCEHPPWDHSAHIIDFVKAVVEDGGSRYISSEANEVLSSLRNLVQSLESPIPVQDLFFPVAKDEKHHADPLFPPLEAAVAVLRWAKDHQGYTRIAMISRILPLEKFTEICQKAYFAVDSYSELGLILANGYLAYIFSEHVAVTGLQIYQEYAQLCRDNFYNAFLRLPLLLPASMEAIAALTLAAFNAIENSKAIMAWTYISAASGLCQSLGYHRLCHPRSNDQPLRDAQERLFWTVYEIDKGLSLRLGRSSNIRDAEITLQFAPDEPRHTRLGRIQGKVYDQLYSPVGLSLPDDERGHMAEALAGELRELITETQAEVFSTTNEPSDCESNAMQIAYLQCDLVCQSSLLCLILRAILTERGSVNNVSDDCVAVARNTLDIHQQCIMALRECTSDPFIVTKYINWAILHTPFIPFNILFTRAIQLLDVTDLARLDLFAASLQPKVASLDSATHPYQLYNLLCQAARLYAPTMPANPKLSHNLPDSLGEFDFSRFGIQTDAEADNSLEASDLQANGLSDWYYGNQQIMNLLDESAMF